MRDIKLVTVTLASLFSPFVRSWASRSTGRMQTQHGCSKAHTTALLHYDTPYDTPYCRRWRLLYARPFLIALNKRSLARSPLCQLYTSPFISHRLARNRRLPISPHLLSPWAIYPVRRLCSIHRGFPQVDLLS